VAKLPVWFDPTLVVLEAVFRGAEPGVLDRSPLKYAPGAVREFNDGSVPEGPPSDAELALGKRRWENALAALRPLIEGGVKIVAGTDVPVSPLVPGFSLHRELQHLVSAGMTPRQAIQAATRNAADAAGRLARSGTIERGKVADVVLLDADPTARIENTTAIRAVVTRGRVLERTALDSVLAAAEAYAKTH
jgi:imidazolonepropionase-like amidohydrolase